MSNDEISSGTFTITSKGFSPKVVRLVGNDNDTQLDVTDPTGEDDQKWIVDVSANGRVISIRNFKGGNNSFSYARRIAQGEPVVGNNAPGTSWTYTNPVGREYQFTLTTSLAWEATGDIRNPVISLQRADGNNSNQRFTLNRLK